MPQGPRITHTCGPNEGLVTVTMYSAILTFFIPWDDAKIRANGGPLIGLERSRASLNEGGLGVMSARPLKAAPLTH